MKTHKIKDWLKRNRYQQSMIADDTGLSRTVVNRTIQDKDRNYKVCRWLVEHGCPEKYVTFPIKSRPEYKKVA